MNSNSSTATRRPLRTSDPIRSPGHVPLDENEQIVHEDEAMHLGHDCAYCNGIAQVKGRVHLTSFRLLFVAKSSGDVDNMTRGDGDVLAAVRAESLPFLCIASDRCNKYMQ